MGAGDNGAVRKARTVQLGLLTLAMMGAAYAKFSLNPLQEALRSDLRISDTQIALLQGMALALPTAAFSLPFGLLIDRYSRKVLTALLLIMLLTGSVLTAMASNFVMLIAARALVGSAVFAMIPAVFSMRTDLYPAAQRGWAAMVMAIGQYCAVSAVFGAAATLMNMFPNQWRTVLLWLTVPPLAVVLLAMFFVDEPVRQERRVANPSFGGSFRELWEFRAVVAPLLIGGTLSLIALGAVMVWAAPALERSYGLSASHVASVMAILLPIGGITGTIVGGVVADKCQLQGGPRKTVDALALITFISAGSGLFPLMPTRTAGVLLLCLTIGVLTVSAIVTSTVSANVVPNEIRGLFSAAAAGLGAVVAVALAPLVVSLLSSLIGGPALIGRALSLTCAGSSLATTAIFLMTRRAFPTSAV